MKLYAIRPLFRSACFLALGLSLGRGPGVAADPTNAPATPPATNGPGKSRFIVDDAGSGTGTIREDVDAKAAELAREADRWMSKGNYAEAATVLEKAVKLSPDNEELRFNLAFSYNRLGRIRDAIAQYRETIRILPEYAEARDNLGNLLVRNGDVGGAVEQFRAAIKLQPDSSSAHNNLGTGLIRMGKPIEAVAQFEEAIRLRPDYPEAWQNLGLTRLNQRQIPAAIEALDTALRLNPRLEGARKALAKARAAAASAAAQPGSPGVNATPASAPR